MSEYKFENHIETAQSYGPRIRIDSCNDGTVWLRASGNGVDINCSFSALQATALADALQAAVLAAMAGGRADEVVAMPEIQNVGDMMRAVFDMGSKP